MPSTPGVREIQDFWFGELHDGFPVTDRQKLWFGSDAAMDRRITRQFAPLLEAVARGQHDNWKATPTGRLALILLVDQFSRNVYRKTARAFANDPLARLLCREGLDSRADRELSSIERVFFYMPLEHSEDIADHDRCVALFDELLADTPQHAQRLEGFANYARGHREIVHRFGRYPHRNTILGRASTPKEEAYLQEGGARFGQ